MEILGNVGDLMQWAIVGSLTIPTLASVTMGIVCVVWLVWTN